MVDRKNCDVIEEIYDHLSGDEYSESGDHGGIRIYHELGISGVDYIDFLDWFRIKYSVDISGLDARLLSPSESPFSNMFRRKYMELTISDFAKLAECGSWKGSVLRKFARYK